LAIRCAITLGAIRFALAAMRFPEAMSIICRRRTKKQSLFVAYARVRRITFSGWNRDDCVELIALRRGALREAAPVSK
jgi:hypothetical protein